MSLAELRKAKKEWLKETASPFMMRKFYKLEKNDILNIKSEIKYGEERFNLKDIKEYLDRKIANNTDQQVSINYSKISNDKKCEHCKKNVNKNCFSKTRSNICIICERKNERKHDKILEQIEISRSRRIRPNQRQML
ncbi:MAG: hypothetical protein NTZ25_00220 [Candidatus Peregrinibacteria bacterium]|nr:hypothetical protein [Candidatus Peregrinibacteria bacterium]